MYIPLIISSVLILLCILLNKALYRFGVPSLLIFLVLGMIMGSDGIGGIYFHNYDIAENISYISIVLIIFYGGFGTKWDTAKPVALKAILMSSLGTVITAFTTGFLCFIIMGVPFLYGLLFGSVVASTDAASVFSILRSRKLNLKNGLAPLLEIESGSNDPFAYMMTILTISAIKAQGAGSLGADIIISFALQIVLAIGIGVIVSVLTVILLRRLQLEIEGFYPIMLLAIVMLSFSICTIAGGNGLLCVYILGIVVGNSKILHKVSLVHFFDSLSWLMQIILFFILGLLAYPSMLIKIIIPGTLLSVLMILVARPLATFSILSFCKTPFKQQLLVSWVGFRGAASIAFAIIAVKSFDGNMQYDLFHLVFFITLFSVLIQGTLTPFIANKLNLVDKDAGDSVLKTFTDYFEETHTRLFEYRITAGDKLLDKHIVDSNIPESILILTIKRGNQIILPRGSTKLLENDIIVASGDDFSFFNE